MLWIVLLLAAAAPAAPAQSGELFGTWSATYGQRVFQGAWTAAAQQEADIGYGTWRLLDASGKTVLGGAWSARKVKAEWRGSWRADVQGGGAYTGTWEAAVKAKGAAAFSELLETAIREVVSGGWALPDGRSGAWSIRAARAGTEPRP